MVKLLAAVFIGSMSITSYRSVPEQTDSTPFITADGSYVTPYGVAVSRNLLRRWGGTLQYGDIVYIESIGFKVVNDTMHERHTNHIDVWVRRLDEERKFHSTFKGKKVRVWAVLRSDVSYNPLGLRDKERR